MSLRWREDLIQGCVVRKLAVLVFRMGTVWCDSGLEEGMVRKISYAPIIHRGYEDARITLVYSTVEVIDRSFRVLNRRHLVAVALLMPEFFSPI